MNIIKKTIVSILQKVLNDKKTQLLFIALQLLIVGIFFVAQASKPQDETIYSPDIANWKSDYIEVSGQNKETNKWVLHKNEIKTNNSIDLVSSGVFSLNKGYYKLIVNYSCYDDQTIVFYTDDTSIYYIDAGEIKLEKQSHLVTYKFKVTENVDNLILKVRYRGNDYMEINNVRIIKNHNGYYRDLITMILIFTTIDIIILLFPIIKDNRITFVLLMTIWFLISLPLLSRGIHLGHDCVFHLTRIEGLSKEIRNLQIPVRMQMYWISEYGYPVSIMYGDILLYFPAVLRLFGVPVTTAYKIFLLLINLFTVVLSYICFKGIFKNNTISLLTTAMYCTSIYKLINVYVRSAVGEYTAMTFYPLLILSLYNIYTSQQISKKEITLNSIFLILGMTGIIQSHVISLFLVVIVIIVVCLANWKKTFTKEVIMFYINSIIGVLMLNLWYIVPFIDYYINVPMLINKGQSSIIKMQDFGAYIVQLFSINQNPFGYDKINVRERMALTPGIVLISFLIYSIWLIINGQASSKIKKTTFISTIVLLMSTNVFPWNWLVARNNFFSVFSKIQFAWRYLGPSTVLLSLLAGILIQFAIKNIDKQHKKIFLYCISFFVVLNTLLFVSQYNDNANNISIYETAELGSYNYMNGEYLLLGNTKDSTRTQTNKKVISTSNNRIIKRKGTTMVVEFEKLDRDQVVVFPIYNYKGYKITDESGNEYKAISTGHNKISFILPKGYEGQIKLSFVSPWYWTASLLISLVSFIILVFVCFKKYLYFKSFSINHIYKIIM